MKKRKITFISILLAIVLLLSQATVATESLAEQPELAIGGAVEDTDGVAASGETDMTELTEGGGVAPLSIADPVKAYLKVNTNSYAAPSPTNGHLNEVVAANTEVWVVEKAYCFDNDRYYYYAGYTYNGASHRGYFCEDNVYKNGSRYLPEDVADETHPGNLKAFTSLSGTVYDGPATTYAQTGSVGQETIEIIRTENDYNYIQYTVSATAKKKRGFLHYSKITGSWASLTAQNASALNGQTFFIKSSTADKYWSTVDGANTNNKRLNLQSFTGDTHQIYRFVYNSEHKFFYIQPTIGYSPTNRRIAIRWVSGTAHADRRVFLKDIDEVYRQQFWVVKTGTSGNSYKIVPVSSYGTMTVTNRSNYLNQYHSSSYVSSGADVWIFEEIKK